jgi:hypothetical protein
MKFLQFTLRELFLLTLVFAMAVTWWVDRTSSKRNHAKGLVECNAVIERLVKERDQLGLELDRIHFMHDGF